MKSICIIILFVRYQIAHIKMEKHATRADVMLSIFRITSMPSLITYYLKKENTKTKQQ